MGGGSWGVRGSKPPGLGHGVQGGSGGRSTPILQVHSIQGGPGACPRFGRLG